MILALLEDRRRSLTFGRYPEGKSTSSRFDQSCQHRQYTRAWLESHDDLTLGSYNRWQRQPGMQPVVQNAWASSRCLLVLAKRRPALKTRETRRLHIEERMRRPMESVDNKRSRTVAR